MKYILVLLLSSCSYISRQTSAKAQEEPTLAWGKERSAWTTHLIREINNSNLRSDVKTPCEKTSQKLCLAYLISVIAKHESGFNPDAYYKESFNDSNGKPVISRGLFQLSVESANQSAYKCDIKSYKELYNPYINITCMVKITVYQANKSGYLIAEPKKGCASYHSVCRKYTIKNGKKTERESYKNIMRYVGAL